MGGRGVVGLRRVVANLLVGVCVCSLLGLMAWVVTHHEVTSWAWSSLAAATTVLLASS